MTPRAIGYTAVAAATIGCSSVSGKRDHRPFSRGASSVNRFRTITSRP